MGEGEKIGGKVREIGSSEGRRRIESYRNRLY